MEECELCGEPMQNVYGINVDSVELRVCAGCAKGKRIVYREEAKSKRPPGRAGGVHAAAQKPVRGEVEVVDDYGRKIRNAREAMRLPTKVLAEMINEKESLLIRVEGQRTLPNEKLTKKLEKALGIKLEQVEEVSEAKGRPGRKDEATLGEFIG
jgi:putative transcription factor